MRKHTIRPEAMKMIKKESKPDGRFGMRESKKTVDFSKCFVSGDFSLLLSFDQQKKVRETGDFSLNLSFDQQKKVKKRITKRRQRKQGVIRKKCNKIPFNNKEFFPRKRRNDGR